MQIVIDIPDEIIKSISDFGTIHSCYDMLVSNAISKGTQLPKGKWHNEDGTFDGICDGWMSAGVKCSVCGAIHCNYMRFYNYCPNCGAKMEE